LILGYKINDLRLTNLIDELKNHKSSIDNQQSNKSFGANGSGIFEIHVPAFLPKLAKGARLFPPIRARKQTN
jgi:hypothetical protein